MSFSADVKNKIIGELPHALCCRKSFLNGILSAKASFIGDTVTLNVENDFVADAVSAQIFEIYGKTPTVTTAGKGGRCRVLSFDSPKATGYLRSLADGEALFTPKCHGCHAAYLRGVFFASGRVSDPQKQYSLEFSPTENADKIAEHMLENGINTRLGKRGEKPLLYIRSCESIESFFAIAGMNSVAFEFMNTKIEREFRNNINRGVNCETNNINKAVSVSQRQAKLIKRLIAANKLSFLPEELQATAIFRLENASLTLSQLAAISVPAISKSGLSHRLNKICEYAEQLLNETKK